MGFSTISESENYNQFDYNVDYEQVMQFYR